ncbi:MAG: acyclic terpene utilization AtuA family protein [Pseudomonadota bacterium]
MSGTERFRLGTGAGFSADRLDPAVDLVTEGELDAIVFECIGERTLAFGHRDRLSDPAKGYNPLLERRLRAVLPGCIANGTRLITNMGVANPNAAASQAVEVARELGLWGRRIAAVGGDDVTDQITPDTELDEPGLRISDVGRKMVGANAYLGADAILPAFDAEADVVITGRVADPSLFLAPLCHAFGWLPDDWATLGAGTLVGHLMECAAQVTGGYFADPGKKDVDNLAYVGFPIAEVDPDGGAVITKLTRAGGLVSERTVKEQLLYEVHDPNAYLTPDVTADFSQVTLGQAGDHRVRIGGAGGAKRPDHLKVTVAFDGGFLAEAGVSYAGPGAGRRAKLALDILEERMTRLHGSNAPLRLDLIGQNALHAAAGGASIASGASTAGGASAAGGEIDELTDVRVRAALRADSRDMAELLLWEVEALLCCGPAGGGGFRGQITPSVVTHTAYIERDRVQPTLRLVET